MSETLTPTPDAEPFGRVIERNVGAGFYLIELAEDEDAALRDDWGDDDGRVRLQPGRVGLESAGSNHRPEIQVTAYLSEPPPPRGTRKTPLEVWGEWPVTFSSGFVEVWSSDSYAGDELPLELPTSEGGRYVMRVAVGHRDTGGLSLDDYAHAYFDAHDATPRGMERFVIDLWPAGSS